MIVTKIVISNYKYNSAIEAKESGDYKTAVEKFVELGDFKDSREQMAELKTSVEFYYVASAKVNDTVCFGSYKGNTEWIVLDKKDKKLLLLSKNAIEYRLYNTEYEDIEWKDCTLRKWLNSDYISLAFNNATKCHQVVR